MLHILPGKEKKTEEESYKEGSSFKNKKAAKTKAQSGRYVYYMKDVHLYVLHKRFTDVITDFKYSLKILRYKSLNKMICDSKSTRFLVVVCWSVTLRMSTCSGSRVELFYPQQSIVVKFQA